MRTMNGLVACAFFLTLTSPAFAESLIGIGNEKCSNLEAKLADAGSKAELMGWIQGYATATNALSVRTSDGLGAVEYLFQKFRPLDKPEGTTEDKLLKVMVTMCKSSPDSSVGDIFMFIIAKSVMTKLSDENPGIRPPLGLRLIHKLTKSERDGLLDGLEGMEEEQVKLTYKLELPEDPMGGLEEDEEFRKGYDFVAKATPKQLVGIIRATSMQRKLTLKKRDEEKIALIPSEGQMDPILQTTAVAKRNLTYTESLYEHSYYPKGHRFYEEQEEYKKSIAK